MRKFAKELIRGDGQSVGMGRHGQGTAWPYIEKELEKHGRTTKWKIREMLRKGLETPQTELVRVRKAWS